MDMNTRHPTLGSLLRSLRARNGWTLSQMSERTNIPVSTLSKVEHDLIMEVHPQVGEIKEGMEEMIAAVKENIEVTLEAVKSDKA